MKVCIRKDRNQHRPILDTLQVFLIFETRRVWEWSSWFRGFWDEIVLSGFEREPRQRSRYSD
jgi:hypothetical protein